MVANQPPPFNPPGFGVGFVGITLDHVRLLSMLFLCGRYIANNPDVYEEMIEWLKLNGGEKPPEDTEYGVAMINHCVDVWLQVQDFLRSQYQ